MQLMRRILQGSHQRAEAAALLYDEGTPEFIAQCKDDFNKRAELMLSTSKRDPEVSRRNLAALEDFKAGKTTELQFEVMK